jgi:hypothetical protein
MQQAICMQTVPVTPYYYLEDLTSKKGQGANNDPLTSQSPIDEDTSSYSVPHNHKERFDQLKCNYAVNLLPVYCHDRFIRPDQVSDLLNGATSEVHLSLTHNYIRKPGEAFKSLNG